MNGESKKIRSYRDLHVYQRAFKIAMRIFEITKKFPKEERYSLTDQIRRSSRSVCTNIGEAWGKRRYQAHFVSKLSDSESECIETQIWIEFSVHCGYMEKSEARELYRAYDAAMGTLIGMMIHPETWVLPQR